jgi:signal peptidase II
MTVAGDTAPRVRQPLTGALLGASVIVVVDQLTKWWALNALDGDRTIDLVWTLRFALAFNEGMAFSRGTGLGKVIAVVALGVIVALVRSLRTNLDVRTRVAMTLVIGGAIGNLVDRIFRASTWLDGAVVDFIDLQWWPVFNVADMAIVCGAVLLAAGVLRGSKKVEYPLA